MTSDLDALGDLAAQGLDGLISGLLSVVAISVTLLVLDLELGLIALAAVLPILLATRWFRHRSRRICRRTRSAIASIIVHFTETINGLRAVLSFRSGDRNRRIFGACNDENARANGDGLVALAVDTPAVRLFGNLSLVATLVSRRIQGIGGTPEGGVLAAVLLYVRRMYDPLDGLAMFDNTYQSGCAALEEISGLLEDVPAVPEPADPVPLGADRADRRRVRLEGVTFSHTPPSRPPDPGPGDPAGQTVAVVGPPERAELGKLLARLCDPTDGRVLLDGTDVSLVGAADLPRRVVMVTKESVLFSGTVADNIALGQPAASRRRSSRPPTRSAPAPSSGRCPKVSTRTCGRSCAGGRP